MEIYGERVSGSGIFGGRFLAKVNKFYEFSDIADLNANTSKLAHDYMISMWDPPYEGGVIRNLRISKILQRTVDNALLKLSDNNGETISVHTSRSSPTGGLYGPISNLATEGYETSMEVGENDEVSIRFSLLDLRTYVRGETTSLHIDGIWYRDAFPYNFADAVTPQPISS